MQLDPRITLYLKQYYGPDATFREGQHEAIQSVLQSNRALVVQKTGWGKSLVYFLATRILRDAGRGPTIVISPLLSLMNNQIESANKFKLRSVTINSNNTDEWDSVQHQLVTNQVDVLFISPERLANQDFVTNVLYRIEQNIGLMVIDEAHCISDWGHDFRPDYRRIVRIVNRLPINVPLLATTATANDRVVEDIKQQLGQQLVTLRGELTRESLMIDMIHLGDQAERLAWLCENLNTLPGTGIIYCLTKGDCDLVANWLNSKGIDVEAYHAGFNSEERNLKEQKLIHNDTKALVATVALGMGFDKPDIGFVIHFQRPGNVIAYYQQIGRAGRNLSNAHAILLCGDEDDEIAEYFINSAFPTQAEMQEIVQVLANSNGLTRTQIEGYLNMKAGRIEKCIKFLEIDGAIYKSGSKYHRSANPWQPNLEYSEAITTIRKNELQRMNDYIHTDQCYMAFIAQELDDHTAKACGKCGNCRHIELSKQVKKEHVAEAIRFIRSNYLTIEPRRKWPMGIFDKTTFPTDFRMEPGLVLSSYGDAGWGKIVRDGKYRNNHFSDELVTASYQLLKDKVTEWQIDYIVSIPSMRRPELVQRFAQRLANQLSIPYLDVIYKKQETYEQKKCENSYYQCANVMNGFDLKHRISGNILIIDDMVDSRWTFTYCAYLLRTNGAGYVYPFALSKTSGTESGE